MKKLVVWVLAALGLGTAGWFGWQYQQKGMAPQEVVAGKGGAEGKGGKDGAGKDGGGKDGASKPGGPGGPGGAGGGPRGPVGVEAIKAETRAIQDEVSAVGTLRAAESVVLKPEVAGRIEKLNFSDGARVKRGTVLVQLDASVAAAEAEQAKAELELSKANFQRTADLAAKNFVSARAKDEAGANLKVLEAKLNVAQMKLAKSQVRAPFEGVMGLRNISIGDYVREGAELVLIEDTKSMKVDLRMPEKFLGQVAKGQNLTVAMDALPGKKFAAKIETIDSQVDSNGRSLLVRSRVMNDSGLLRTGMFARAAVILQDRPQAIVIPEEAIVPLGADVIVYKIIDGKAMRTPVKTGIRTDGKVEIVKGVDVGDLIVTAGQIKLPRDAMEVRVIDPNRRPGGGPGGPGKGGEGKPGEGKPAEGKPSEGKSAEGKPAEGKPSEGKKS